MTWLLIAAEGDPTNVVEWFTDLPARASSGPIPSQVWITLWHSLVAAAVAVAVAVPLAVVLAHFRKAELVSQWVVNLGRVIPTVAVVGIAVIVSLRNGFGFEPWPIVIALVLLALPPVYANTYASIRSIEPELVDAARGMGLSERQIMSRVEVPLALPVIFTGIRVAVVQLIATEAIGAYFGGEGLGVYIRQGIANRDDPEVQAGALLITGVAMACDLVLWLVGRLLMPRGLRPTGGRRAAQPAQPDDVSRPGEVSQPLAIPNPGENHVPA